MFTGRVWRFEDEEEEDGLHDTARTNDTCVYSRTHAHINLTRVVHGISVCTVCVLHLRICSVFHVCVRTGVISYVFFIFLCIMLRTGVILQVLLPCMYDNMFVILYFCQPIS